MGFLKCTGRIVCLAGGCASVFAQHVSLGVIGGASLTQDFQNASFAPGVGPGLTIYSTPKRYIAGGMLDIALPLHFSIEVDGLYHELKYTWAAVLPNGTLNSISPSPVVTWEFPVLAKYRFSFPVVRPLIEAGPSFRVSGNLNGTSPSNHGFTVGAGFEKQAWKLKIEPQIRYTRWAKDGEGAPVTKPDQLELLVGFRGGTGSDWHPWGHSVSFGVVLGTNLTDDFRKTSSTASLLVPTPGDGITNLNATFLGYSGPRSFIAGPTVEVKLPRQFSVEVDAIHRPLKSASKTILSGGSTFNAFNSIATLTSWQCPVVAKYKFSFPFGEHFPKLFAEAGPSFRLPQQINFSFLSNYGFTGGLGLHTQVRAFKIEPVIRYTHWGADNPRGDSQVFRNEASFLVGFSF